MNRLSRSHYVTIKLSGLELCLLLLGLISPSAHGRCIAHLQAGFPHADVRYFPANIRGVLFQASASSPLSTQDFEIASKDDGRGLRIRIEPVALPADSAASRNLPRATQLVRIMIEGGYAAGSTYSIRYTAPRSLPMQYPDAISFTVDPAPVSLTPVAVSLLLHRPQVRAHAVENEDTSVSFVAATSRLESRVSAELQRYQAAVSFFPEWTGIDNASTPDAYTPLRQAATSCSGESFGASARGKPDVVYQACNQPMQAKALRVTTGFFEIDDRLHALPAMRADWDADTQAACAVAALKRLSRDEEREAVRSSILRGATESADVQ